jgi:Ca2+-binding EF-hand superfamily protein
MTYVAYYWKKFASSNKSEKQARMIARVAKNAKDNAKMASDYEERAKKLLAWTAEKSEAMANHEIKSFGNNLSKVQDNQKKFQDFKKSEKPTNTKEKADLAIFLVNLQSKQKQEKFPVYYPPTELATAAINEQWNTLENIIKEYETSLREAVSIMKRVEMQLNRYRARSKKVLEWQAEKETWLGGNEMTDPESVAIESLRANVNMLKAFSSELESVKKTLDSAVEVGTQVIDAEHSDADEVMETNIKMKEGNESVSTTSNQKLEELEKVLIRREEITRMCVEFSTKSDSLNVVLEGCLTDAVEPVSASNVKDVDIAEEALKHNMEQYEQSLPLLSECADLHQKVTEAGGNPEIYSRNKLTDIQEKCELTKKLMDEKQATLGPEREKQEKNQQLLEQFNGAASKYIDWGKSTLEEIQAEQEGIEFEEQLSKLQKVGQVATKESKDTLENLSEYTRALEEADIVEQSEHTIGELQSLDQQIQAAFIQRSKGLENQIFAKKMTSVSQEQLDEFRETFTYFDKDKSGALTKNEFKAACASIGEDIPDNELDSVFKSFDKDGDGKIVFSEFIDYMVSVAKEGTGYDDVLGAYKELAGGADMITASQLGAAMDKEDTEYLISVMPKVDDAYDYVAYLNTLFGK